MCEKSKKKVTRGLFTKDSLTWLAAVMQNLLKEKLFLLNTGEISEKKRWKDHYGVVEVAVYCNDNGCFAHLESSPVALQGKKVIFCFPVRGVGGRWPV